MKSINPGDQAVNAELSDTQLRQALAQAGGVNFRFRELDDLSPLVNRLSALAAEPTKVSLGLTELMLNAIEHGVLGISSEEKRALARAGDVHDEVRRRLAAPEYAGLDALVTVTLDGELLCFLVTDPGQGFDWRSGLVAAADNSGDDPHGRGIAIAARVAFARIEYRGCGNVVAAWAAPCVALSSPNGHQVQPTIVSETDPQTQPTQAMKILVVDDAPTNRKILQVFLGRLGHQVILASDGAEAIVQFGAERPDLVLMDVMMPNMDGLEAAAQIKAQFGERWVPIVFLSALTTDEQMVSGLESGGDDYLTKPVNFTVLKAKLRSYARTLEMQRKLDAAHKQMASISENISDAVVTADTAGTIRWASQSALLTFGYSLDELVGQNIRVLLSDTNAYARIFASNPSVLEGADQSVGAGPREVDGRRKSGAVFPMELALTEMSVEGERSYVAVMRDITQRKAIELRLRSDAERLSAYYDEQEREHDLAKDVVKKIMDHPGLTEPGVRFWIQPANHFSGDVVAASRRADGKLFVVLADATGHGLAAAMSALPLLTLFYGAMYGNRSLAFVVFHMNRMMRTLLPVGRFVAATLLAVDEKTGVAEVWVAGMPDLVVLGADGCLGHRIPATQVPLGVMDMTEAEAEAQMVRVPLQEGDEFVLVSDGAIEAVNAHGEEFGIDRLVATAGSSDSAARFDMVRNALVAHVEAAVQRDDISLLLVQPRRLR